MAELVETQVSRYQEYKPTGVEWMPEIPVGWEVKKLKFVAVINPSRDSSKLEESAESVVFLPMEAVGEDGSFRQDTFKALIDVQSGYTYFEQDDVLLAKITPCFENGKATVLTGLVTPVGFGSTEFHVIRPKQSLTVSRFLFYTVKSELFLRLGEGVMVGSAGQKRVPTDFLTEFPLPVPSLEEQEAVAQFLDDKTAQLDQLITQKQQMLELLREERAALINHVVTKGLDAAAPLCDSGVEWLGEVPAHWEVKKLKWIAEIQGGIALSAGKQLENPVTLPYLRVANVQDGYLDLSEVKTVEVEPEQIARYKLHKGDLLMNEGGDSDKLGRGCVWHGEIEPCLHQNHVFAVRLFNGYNPEWLNLITATEGARTHFLTRAKQSTNLASISSSNIKEMPVLLPPVAEQREIMAVVAEETARVAEATTTINQEIALLQEYRAALIAEAVTGQIDVRHYVPASVLL